MSLILGFYLIFKYIMNPPPVPNIQTGGIQSAPSAPNIENITSKSSSFFDFNLDFTTKIILCLVIMLILHYAYKFIKKRFFNNSTSFEEDEEILKDMDGLDLENMDENSEYFDENEQLEMEQSLQQELNTE